MAKEIHVPATMTTVVRPSTDGFPRQTFLPHDTNILASLQGRLNDACINGCAALLYSEFLPAAASCAILSTHDLPWIRYNVDDDILWRNLLWTRFWEKPIWVLPVHRSLPVEHWVLCVIHFPSRQLLLFDSLAEQQPWRKDVKVSHLSKNSPILTRVQDIMQLICRFSNLVTRRLGTSHRDRGDWVARPVLVGFENAVTLAAC